MSYFKSGFSALAAFVFLFTSVGIIAPGTAGATAATYYQELDLTGNSAGWNGNPAKDISFSIPAVTERPGTIAQLLIYAYDIRAEDGETARVYWGEDESGLYLGDLSGMASQWSVSVLEVPLDAIQNTNPVYITVNDTSGGSAWEVEIAWAQLLFDGGPGIDARVDDPTVTYLGPYINVFWYLQGLNAGAYVSPAQVIDENGYNLREITGSHNFSSPDRVTSSFAAFNQGTVHTTHFMIGDPYEGNMNRLGRVHHIVTIKTSQVPVLDRLAFKDNGQNIELSPSFAPLTRAYSSTVSYSTAEVTPVAIPFEGHAVTARINGSATDPFAPVPSSIPLQVGRNTIEYLVTNVEDPAGKIYTVTIDRLPKLDSLVGSPAMTLSPVFDGDMPNPASGYHSSVENHVDKIVLTPILPAGAGLNPEDVAVSINGQPFEALVAGTSNTSELPLNVGRNAITVRVTSPDDHVYTDYPFTMDRAPALADLSFSAGDEALTPGFSSNEYVYSTVVGHAETPIGLTPTVNDGETVELRVNSNNEADFAAIVPNVQTGGLALIAGINKVEVRVKSSDYDTALSAVPGAEKANLVKIYTFNVARFPFLTDLVVSGENLTESFDAAKLDYSINRTIPYTQPFVKVMPTSSDSPVKLEVRVNGGAYETIDSGTESEELTMQSGANKIDIKSTSVNPLDQQEYSTVYSVVVNKGAPPQGSSSSSPTSSGPSYRAFELDAGIDNKGQRMLVTDMIGKELTLSAYLVKSDGTRLDSPAIPIDSNGRFTLSNIPSGTYSMVMNVNGPSGEKLAGGVSRLTVGAGDSGKASGKPIDPQSKATDASTGDALQGVKITLYWADTALNRSKGRTPGEIVKLPALAHFAPHKNNAVQTTPVEGTFGWVPFIDGDYYFIAVKDGYEKYDSREDDRNRPLGDDSSIKDGIIHVAHSVFTYDLAMKPDGWEEPGGTHRSYMKGYPDGSFKPERGISRAELAAVLVRILPQRAFATQNAHNLSDLAEPFWAAESINIALDQGWMKGTAAGAFHPDKLVTRAELAQVAYNIKAEEWNSISSPVSTAFNDVRGHWGADAITAAASNGIVEGYADGSFKPNNAVTRAEAATLLNRLLDRTPGKVGEQPLWPDVPTSHWAYKNIMEASVTHRYNRSAAGSELWSEK
ncbi:S-layer homology domain-containing protein [Cohnella cellulosilytica]|uniref:S-layer homology domain-containing protein n=1 Tax=Cohnella cellulosilytica TaxID=986710 RepID=A0ABW2FIU6_9BACL